MTTPVDAVLIGAGERGTFVYGRAAIEHPGTVRFVAVAEPNPDRRTCFASQHNIPSHHCFETWEQLLAAGQLAPALVCATLDHLHAAPAVAALEAGYHVLLEKPMAVTAEDCIRVVQAEERTGRLLVVCHVLRYAPFFRALHEIVTSGRIGEIVSIEHRENLAFWHMAHSYVRGNWATTAGASPMILAKCCHDLDLLVWMTPGNPVERLHSFGSLLHFRPEKAPLGVTRRCTDGCPAADMCAFYAPILYLTDDLGWPTETISTDLSYEGRLVALQTGPYGRCIYHADNTAVDHQVVTMEHASGAVSTLVMHGHSDVEERTMRYDGTQGTIRARFRPSGDSEITLHDHRTGRFEHVWTDASVQSGHGDGDERLLFSFAEAIRTTRPGSLPSARMSLESHLLAFAAERSRATRTVVELGAYRAEIEASASAGSCR